MDEVQKQGIVDDIGKIIGKIPLDKLPSIINEIKKIIDSIIGNKEKNPPQSPPPPINEPVPTFPSTPGPQPEPIPTPTPIPELENITLDGEWKIEGNIIKKE